MISWHFFIRVCLCQLPYIPATVDTVLVQSYDLISPLTSDYIYALGLSQNNLPKITQNTSLLSDEERETLNQVTQEGSQLMIASQENLKKNRYTMLSLVNSARKQLVLSAPSLFNEDESEESIYLKELQNLGFTKIEKRIDRKIYRKMILVLITVFCLVSLPIINKANPLQVMKT